VSLDRSDRAQLEDILGRYKLVDVFDAIRAIYRERTEEFRRQGTGAAEEMAAKHGIALDLLHEARQAAFTARAEIEARIAESACLALGIEMELW